MDTTTLLSVIELIENQISNLEERLISRDKTDPFILADKEAIHQLRLLMDHLQCEIEGRLNGYEMYLSE